MVRATAIAAERIAWSGSEDGRDFAILSGSRANLTLPIREGLPERRRNQKTSVWRLLNFHLHIAGNGLNECGADLVATEGWGDRSQNCLHDVRVIGDT
jgi:hypothetical protein